MPLAKDKNVFWVSGFIGADRRNQYQGYCVAADKAEAIRLMAHAVDGLNISGLTSLAEMNERVKALQAVLEGKQPVPMQPGFSIR